nr:immunoglobulin heavy chain junction region [Macaca mulatta]MOX63008.1 immunoglobulin heavy chain junction region [Macaca mulatta]
CARWAEDDYGYFRFDYW